MTESSLSLAARLAANLFVDAITLAKPAGRLAAKIGDRVLGGSKFNEAEAQRFLYEDALNRVEEQAEVLEPLVEPHPVSRYERRGTLCEDYELYGCSVSTCPTGCYLALPSNPADAAAHTGVGGDQTAPGLASPVEQAPSPASSPDAGSGAINERSEHPMYAQIQDVADAAVVAGVLGLHQCFWNDDEAMYHCISDDELHATFGSYNQWIAHVSPLIIAELQ